MPSADTFRAEIEAQIHRAHQQERPHVEINAGELHRKLGGYPAVNAHQMPTCCHVLWSVYDSAKDNIVFRPESGYGPSLTIQFAAVARGQH